MSILLNFLGASDDAVFTNENVFYFIGESNSGGQAFNAPDATSEELANNPNVQILNNTDLVFENLQIGLIVSTGKNNLIGHDGIDPDEQWHGWELQLANRANEFSNPFLIKCGQGGSILSEWDDGGTYDSTFKFRSNKGKKYWNNNNINATPYVFMSIGINDRIAGTDTTVFYNQLVDWVGRVQAQTAAVKIFITTFDAPMSALNQPYNDEIINAANAIDYLIRIDTTGASLQNSNHWDYDGMKQICNSMLDLI